MAITRHAERRVMPYTQAQMFELVSDVKCYPEFLPWCQAARVRRREGDTEFAELAIGFGPLHEKFASRIVLAPDNPDGPSIETTGIEGPFRLLTSRWIFRPDESGTLVDFELAFEFRSLLLQHTARVVFAEAVRRMVSAFEGRAGKLYGNSNARPSPPAA